MFASFRRPGAVLVVLCLLLVGCQPVNVKVTGTVLNGGKPFTLSPTGVVQVTLIPDVAPGADFTTYPGRADAAGAFTIEDVPPGKYKVAVEQFDPNPLTDVLQGAFSAGKTKLVRDVDGKTPLAIDVGTP